MTEESKLKWEGRAIVGLPSTGAEAVWPFLEDFCNLHKCFPIDTSYQVEGIQGQPGLIRYCASTLKGDAAPDETAIKWAKEELLTIDPVQRCLSYEIVDNIGLKSYVATLKVVPGNGDDNDTKLAAGCKIVWGFVSDPMEGWSFQGLKSYIESSLQFIANKTDQLACSKN